MNKLQWQLNQSTGHQTSESAMTSTFVALDWLMFVLYFVLLAPTRVGGLIAVAAQNSQEYFIGSNNIPTWLAAISVLATAQSAATFLGWPR